MRQIHETAFFVTFGVLVGWFAWGPECPWWRTIELIFLSYGLAFSALFIMAHISPSKNAIKKYTLVELLVVVAIICVIMGAAMPAFVKMAKGGGVGYGASGLAGKYKQARDYAISNRTYAALVMPDDTTTINKIISGSPTTITCSVMENKNMLFSTYRVAEVASIGGKFYFRKWADTSWNQMPVGAAIAEVTAGTWNPVYDVDVRDIQDSAGTRTLARCVVVKPYGGLVETSPTEMRVQEATNVNGALVVTSAENASIFRVNAFTGSVKFIK